MHTQLRNLAAAAPPCVSEVSGPQLAAACGTSAAQLDPGLFLDEVLSVFALAPEADMLVESTILLITSDVMLMVGAWHVSVRRGVPSGSNLPKR